MTQLDQALPAKARRTGRDRATGWRDALIERQAETWAAVREVGSQPRTHLSDKATYVLGDAIQWLAELPPMRRLATAPDFDAALRALVEQGASEKGAACAG